MRTSIGKALASIGICIFLTALIAMPVGCWRIGAAGVSLAVSLAIIWDSDEQKGENHECND